VGGLAFIYLILALHKVSRPKRGPTLNESIQHAAEEDVDHIFNEEFREELRNRGRLHFEKILGENAMFLQQDLRLTTSQLNDYMKQEISKELKEAFANYESAIGDAKQLAVESIEKTKTAIDEQRQTMSDQLEKEITAEKVRRIALFENNMAQVVNHYVLGAVGNQIDLNDQLEYILGELEANKRAIVEDITNGA
jgi:F0F1-type ATP synthase membrane subunit b/b'